MRKHRFVNPTKTRPGPIRHRSLSPELLEQIGAVYEMIGPFLGTTLEQFEIAFMRDPDPHIRAIVWRSIKAAWYLYHEYFLDCKILPYEEEHALIAALIVISTGVKDLKMLNVPDEVGKKLVECYDGLIDNEES